MPKGGILVSRYGKSVSLSSSNAFSPKPIDVLHSQVPFLSENVHLVTRRECGLFQLSWLDSNSWLLLMRLTTLQFAL